MEHAAKHLKLSIDRARSVLLKEGVFEADIFVTGLIGNVLHDQLEHLIRRAHASVGTDDFSRRAEGMMRIVRGVVIDTDRRNRGTLRKRFSLTMAWSAVLEDDWSDILSEPGRPVTTCCEPQKHKGKRGQ